MSQHTTYSQAAKLYRNTATAVSPLTGVVMLYDGVIAELSRTISALDRRRLDEAFGHVETATAILRGLCHNLDFERGGALAERMRDTYVRLILATLNSLGKRDAVARLTKLIAAVTNLRDAWAAVRVWQAKGTVEKI